STRSRRSWPTSESGGERGGRRSSDAVAGGARSDVADPGVAAGERSPDAAVPVPPVVLGVRARGLGAPRCDPRPVAGPPPTGALPPVGRRRHRPGTEHTFAHGSRLTDA